MLLSTWKQLSCFSMKPILFLVVSCGLTVGAMGEPTPKIQPPKDLFVELAVHLYQQHDEQGVRLLIEYAKSKGKTGEMDLFGAIVSFGVPAPEAHLIFDHLLKSADKGMVISTVQFLGYDYAGVCDDEELKQVKAFTKCSDEQLRKEATSTVQEVEGVRAKAKAAAAVGH